MASFLHCPTLLNNTLSAETVLAELISISVSCFFVAGIFYTLWWIEETLVIPAVAGCILFATCICIKIGMGHTISPSIHVSITVFYSLYFILQYGRDSQTLVEREPVLPATIAIIHTPVMSKLEAIVRISLILIYGTSVMWSRLYIGANTPNEAIVGVILGALFMLLEFKITPLMLTPTTTASSEKME